MLSTILRSFTLSTSLNYHRNYTGIVKNILFTLLSDKNTKASEVESCVCQSPNTPLTKDSYP